MVGQGEPVPSTRGEGGAAFARLFERLRRPLLRYLTHLLGRREEAEDVVQETCLRLLDAHGLDPSDFRVRGLAYKIATNLAYDRFRQRRVHAVQDEAALADVASKDEPLEGVVVMEQALAIIKRAVLDLKPRCREVFLLRTIDELAYEEIAARLGISKRTVEREMQHALEVCQRRIAARTRR